MCNRGKATGALPAIKMFAGVALEMDFGECIIRMYLTISLSTVALRPVECNTRNLQ